MTWLDALTVVRRRPIGDLPRRPLMEIDLGSPQDCAEDTDIYERIAAVSYTPASDSVALTIDTSRASFEALLSRLATTKSFELENPVILSSDHRDEINE